MTKLVTTTISIEQLEPDMVTASDVRDRSGRLLAGSGMTITPKHIKIFKTWGVVTLEVSMDEAQLEELGLSADGDKGETEVDLAEATQYVDALFELTNFKENSEVRQLHDLIVQRVAQGKQPMR